MPKVKTKLKAKDHDGIIDQIVQQLKKLSDEAVQHPKVIREAKSLKGSSKNETLRNCFDYVWQKVPYCDDPKGQEFITAPWALIEGKKNCEDCESMVCLLSSLLRINGFKTREKVLSWKNPKDLRFTHIVLEAYNKRWIILDPTMKQSGFGNTAIPNREKTYEVNMPSLDMVTLSDKPSYKCKCKGKCRRCRGKSSRQFNNSNQPVINVNVGNTSKDKLMQRLGFDKSNRQSVGRLDEVVDSQKNSNADEYMDQLNSENKKVDYKGSHISKPKKKRKVRYGVPEYTITTGGKTYRYNTFI